MHLKPVFLAPIFLVSMSLCQTVPTSADQSVPTFQSRVPIVLVDVIVTNNRGEPVKGLKQTDFQVFEDGKAQVIASFEEHKGELTKVAQLKSLPAGVFSNSRSLVSRDSIDVLLIDGLNTSMYDQAFVHSQILKYLRTIPPGARVAVFTLTTRLRMLQEFTTDSSALLAAVNSKVPYSSPLLPSEAERAAQQQNKDFLAAERLGPPPSDLTHNSVDPGAALQELFQEMAVRLSEARVRITLQCLQNLATYLAAFPGRKNVLWVSGSFPILFLPNSDLPNPFRSIANFQREIEQTANLLTSARVAIYPVAAQGLAANTAYQANALEISQTRPSIQSEQSGPGRNVLQPELLYQSMEGLANDTGGQAFYHTNGIGEALARITKSSAEFYTLTYSPGNRQMDGKYRRISVKLRTGKDKISYRHGYFARNSENTAEVQKADLLSPALAYGMPDISQLVYEVQVAQTTTQAVAVNNGTPGTAKNPVTTYNFDLEVSPDQLQFEVTPDGVHHGKIELKLVLYDETGKVLNLVSGSFALTLKPDRFEQMRRQGLRFREQINVPETSSNVRIHSGIRDLNSGRIGTLALRMGNRNTSAANK